MSMVRWSMPATGSWRKAAPARRPQSAYPCRSPRRLRPQVLRWCGALGSRCVPVRHADVFYSSPWCGRSGTYLCLWHRERVPLSGAQLDGAFYHASVGCRKRNCARRASFDGGSEVECAGRSEIPRVGNRVSVASRGDQPINGASACSRGYECRAHANSA